MQIEHKGFPRFIVSVPQFPFISNCLFKYLPAVSLVAENDYVFDIEVGSSN